ncbi:hypothetical protein Tco_0726845 [Tanacetum coccineum]|uniref:Uncharacterized protein n=1 Tax=Tanacetum coccineum TaxID=301880 RepID=A0ABQ4YGQ7_9ASTR
MRVVFLLKKSSPLLLKYILGPRLEFHRTLTIGIRLCLSCFTSRSMISTGSSIKCNLSSRSSNLYATGTNSFYDFEWPNVPWTQLTTFPKANYALPRRYLSNKNHVTTIENYSGLRLNPHNFLTALRAENSTNGRTMFTTTSFKLLIGRVSLCVSLLSLARMKQIVGLSVDNYPNGVFTPLGVLGSPETKSMVIFPTTSTLGISVVVVDQIGYGALAF